MLPAAAEFPRQQLQRPLIVSGDRSPPVRLRNILDLCNSPLPKAILQKGLKFQLRNCQIFFLLFQLPQSPGYRRDVASPSLMHIVWPGLPTRYIVAPIIFPLIIFPRQQHFQSVEVLFMENCNSVTLKPTLDRSYRRRVWCSLVAGHESKSTRIQQHKSHSRRSILFTRQTAHLFTRQSK